MVVTAVPDVLQQNSHSPGSLQIQGSDGGESEYESADEEELEEEEEEEDILILPDGVQEDNKPLDDDEDRKNPQYIPKKGTFYEHDDRTAAEEEGEKPRTPEEPQTAKKEVTKKKVWKEDDRWKHDKFSEFDQSPKSREELITTYGYDIRNEEGPPRARRRRRYGRGPNKYTRNWEDLDAYAKPTRGSLGGAGSPGLRGRGSQRSLGGSRKTLESDEEFPALGKNPRQMRPEIGEQDVRKIDMQSPKIDHQIMDTPYRGEMNNKKQQTPPPQHYQQQQQQQQQPPPILQSPIQTPTSPPPQHHQKTSSGPGLIQQHQQQQQQQQQHHHQQQNLGDDNNYQRRGGARGRGLRTRGGWRGGPPSGPPGRFLDERDYNEAPKRGRGRGLASLQRAMHNNPAATHNVGGRDMDELTAEMKTITVSPQNRDDGYRGKNRNNNQDNRRNTIPPRLQDAASRAANNLNNNNNVNNSPGGTDNQSSRPKRYSSQRQRSIPEQAVPPFSQTHGFIDSSVEQGYQGGVNDVVIPTSSPHSVPPPPHTQLPPPPPSFVAPPFTTSPPTTYPPPDPSYLGRAPAPRMFPPVTQAPHIFAAPPQLGAPTAIPQQLGPAAAIPQQLGPVATIPQQLRPAQAISQQLGPAPTIPTAIPQALGVPPTNVPPPLGAPPTVPPVTGPPPFLPPENMINFGAHPGPPLPPPGAAPPHPPQFPPFQGYNPGPVSQPGEIYSNGVTYYNTETQHHIPRHIPILQKRPKAAIPIVPPPERERKGQRRMAQYTEGDMSHDDLERSLSEHREYSDDPEYESTTEDSDVLIESDQRSSGLPGDYYDSSSTTADMELQVEQERALEQVRLAEQEREKEQLAEQEREKDQLAEEQAEQKQQVEESEIMAKSVEIEAQTTEINDKNTEIEVNTAEIEAKIETPPPVESKSEIPNPEEAKPTDVSNESSENSSVVQNTPPDTTDKSAPAIVPEENLHKAEIVQPQANISENQTDSEASREEKSESAPVPSETTADTGVVLS